MKLNLLSRTLLFSSLLCTVLYTSAQKTFSDEDIEMLCKHFKLSTVDLYRKLGDNKPGQIIRKERIKTVRKMRKELASEKQIAPATGFSVSYLKKI